jgi:23S rRNA pseudouridine2605 synthase
MPPRSKPRRKPARAKPMRFGPPARRESVAAAKKSARVPAAEGAERLQKVLAAAGVAGRRECEQLILDGRVEVDRQVVTELGTRVDPTSQEIRVDGETVSQPKLVYFAVNKPDGVVSTSRDPAGRPRVIDLLPPDTPRTYCVGRLDRASEGLILVTNDGELANGLTHPRHGVEKIYQVQVAGRIEQAELLSLKRGSHFAEGFAHVKQVRIKNHRHRSTVQEMVLDEGRNREIRRLLAKVGHKVQRLTRIAVGPVRLGELPSGAVRMLTRQEVSALKEAVSRGRGSRGRGKQRESAEKPLRKSAPKRAVAKTHVDAKEPRERRVIS